MFFEQWMILILVFAQIVLLIMGGLFLHRHFQYIPLIEQDLQQIKAEQDHMAQKLLNDHADLAYIVNAITTLERVAAQTSEIQHHVPPLQSELEAIRSKVEQLLVQRRIKPTASHEQETRVLASLPLTDVTTAQVSYPYRIGTLSGPN